MPERYALRFQVEYPDRELDRVSTGFRIFTVIPIAIVLAALSGASAQLGTGAGSTTLVLGGAGLLFLPPLLMLVFREKYPRWWLDWNRELLRFTNRVGAYLALMSDRYPATDDEQYVRLDFDDPEPRRDLNR